MRIERFRIQGFKSIVDLTVDGLADINVFFGLNDVGKSNIFEALKRWRQSTMRNPGRYTYPQDDAQYVEWINCFRLGGSGIIDIEVQFRVDEITASSFLHIEKKDGIEIQVTIENNPDFTPPPGIGANAYLLSHLKFHVIDAHRRFQIEQRTAGRLSEVVTANNLKQSLFYAYLSSNIDQKNRLNAIKRVLLESPYQLGELDIALDPLTDEINIGFVRPDGRVLLENIGSGVQQLLLVLGQIFLNDYPIIAVEEPEMNLSPQYQAQMMTTLETLMRDPAVKLEQLFISTHSPYLEFTQNFYDVTNDPVKGTQIHHATNADYNQHFAIVPTSSDTGARLNSMNQVKLYEGVVEDLGLHRGDLVVFARNDAGRWEVHSGRELANKLEPITNGKID